MPTILSKLVLISTCVPAFASNNGIESQPFAISTNALDVARRQTDPCTAESGTPPKYICRDRSYTEVPDTEWASDTVKIDLFNNAITFIPANAFNGLTLMTSLRLGNNKIKSIPDGLLDDNTALKYVYLGNNDITSMPVRMLDNTPELEHLYLGNNPLVCSDTQNWVDGTALASICTSCEEGTPKTITIDTVDFLQCCIAKNDDPSPTEVDNAMVAFCPDYATGVQVKGKPEYGSSAEMCKVKDQQKYGTRLHQAMFHGMFGGASDSDRICNAWCLYDLEEEHRHFRWDNRKGCWKTRKAKARACKDSTNEEREFAADIFNSFKFCAAGSVYVPPPVAPVFRDSEP